MHQEVCEISFSGSKSLRGPLWLPFFVFELRLGWGSVMLRQCYGNVTERGRLGL